jgi:predicted MPP superfamily phosphohydrolase
VTSSSPACSRTGSAARATSLPAVERPGRAVAAGAAAAGLAAAGIAWRGLWHEPRSERIRERELGLPAWPAALDGLRVALVSDLHAGAPHMGEERIERVVAAVRDERPDLILLLGDYVDYDVHFGSAVAPEAVAERLAPLRAPRGVIAVLGNHDWRHDGPRVRDALRGGGIPVLQNEAMRAGEGLWVAGVEDTRHRVPDVGDALRDVPDGAPVILLSHDPDLFPQVPARVALTVSGHLHGGQVGVPVVRRPFLPSRFGERYARGHKIEGGRHLFVTAGLGTTGWPVRLLAPPEIVVLRLTRGAAPPRGPGARPRRGRARSRAAGRPRWSAPAPRSR